MLVDTVTLLSKNVYDKYFASEKLLCPKMNLTSYSKNKITLLGCFSANIRYNATYCKTIIYVTEEGTFLIGRDLLHKLGIKSMLSICL